MQGRVARVLNGGLMRRLLAGLAILAVQACTQAGPGPAGNGAAASPTGTSNDGAPTHRPSFEGVWQVADPNLVQRPDVYATQADYTPEAWANLQAYKRDWNIEVDDPAKFCVAYGMPNTMTSRARDYAIDIQQSERRVTVLLEYMDNRRLIHLAAAGVPETFQPSPNGWSTGRWDGDTLRIETVALSERSPVGPVQRGADARIEESWRLREDPTHGTVIDIEFVLTDPAIYRHPMKGRQVLKRAPDGTVLNTYGCADALWDDWVERRRAERASASKTRPSKK